MVGSEAFNLIKNKSGTNFPDNLPAPRHNQGNERSQFFPKQHLDI
jgi:hypothetical protein